MDGAVGALGEGFAQGGGDALGPGAEGDDFAAMLFLQLQGLFERVGVGLVDGVGEVGVVDPLAGRCDVSWASRSGTCLMATMIFMGWCSGLGTEVRLG